MNSQNLPPSDEKPKFIQLFEERIVGSDQYGANDLVPTEPREIDVDLALAGLEEVKSEKGPNGRYNIDSDRASRLGLVADLCDVKEVQKVEKIATEAVSMPLSAPKKVPSKLRIDHYIKFPTPSQK